jgi:hypothetical protein
MRPIPAATRFSLFPGLIPGPRLWCGLTSHQHHLGEHTECPCEPYHQLVWLARCKWLLHMTTDRFHHCVPFQLVFLQLYVATPGTRLATCKWSVYLLQRPFLVAYPDLTRNLTTLRALTKDAFLTLPSISANLLRLLFILKLYECFRVLRSHPSGTGAKRQRPRLAGREVGLVFIFFPLTTYLHVLFVLLVLATCVTCMCGQLIPCF